MAFAWTILLVFGGSGLQNINTSVQSLQERIVALQVENMYLKAELAQAAQQLAALKEQNAQLLERIRFLEQCLSTPLPWPGGQLCPKPKVP